MASQHRVQLSAEEANAVVESLNRQQQHKEAKPVSVSPGSSSLMFYVEVEPGRFLIIDNDDINTDRNLIIRSVIEKAKKGDLDAVKFLLDHSNFEFPDFKVNGGESKYL